MNVSRSTYFSNGFTSSNYRGKSAVLKKSLDTFYKENKSRLFSVRYVVILVFIMAITPNSFSQTVTLPSPINVIKVNPIVSGLGSLMQKENVGQGYEMEFSVIAQTLGVGIPENNEFHWIVYGGTIEAVTGGTLSGTVNKYSHEGNEVSDLFAKGWKDGESSIRIKWQTNECENAYIAVKQTSEYGCSDDVYSIYYVSVKTINIDMEVVPQAPVCAKATDNFISFDMTILNHKIDDEWKFKYELRTRDSEGSWSEWIQGSTATINTVGDPNYGYVLIPAGKDNEKYTLNIPLSDNNKIKGSGDFLMEIRITDVRDAYNNTLESLPGKNTTVILHKIPKTDFGITTDD